MTDYEQAVNEIRIRYYLGIITYEEALQELEDAQIDLA